MQTLLPCTLTYSFPITGTPKQLAENKSKYAQDAMAICHKARLAHTRITQEKEEEQTMVVGGEVHSLMHAKVL